MTPIRIDTGGVEPVTLAEMRAYLRIDPDRTEEDAVIASLIGAARAGVEMQARRTLLPGRFRLTLTAWPRDGVLPVPLSPLVAVERAGTVGADGPVQSFDAGLLRIGPDPWEAPCLVVDPARPDLDRRAALIELRAGCGGDGPPVPAPFLQAIRMSVAAWFEHRGDADAPAGPAARGGLPGDALALIAPYRRMRL